MHIRLARYYLAGKRPWSRGYFEYKWREISRSVGDMRLMTAFAEGMALPQGYGIGIDERIVEFPWTLAHMPEAPGSLLDAGSALNFLPLVSHPAVASKRLTIITLAPETNNFARRGISYIYGDIREMPFRDGTFDCITCISTLEHVGLDNAAVYTHDARHREHRPDEYLRAIRELHRVLAPGGRLLITVPFGGYEDIGFMQQFTPEMVDAVIAACPWKESAVTYYRYTADGWNTSTREESNSARYFNIHATTAIEPDRTAAARAVACIILTK